MLIRAIIVDDEQPAVDKMEILLKESGVVEVEGKFTDPREALKYMERNYFDVVFLDIEMPEVSGIELAKIIKDRYDNIAIVFITAYDKYAVEAFRINAMDYIMKPFNREVLKETLERIIQNNNIQIYPSKAKIFCFGKFKLTTAKGEKIKFRTAKAEELLAFLLNQRGAEVSRNEIIDCLWPEFDGDKAVANFNATLYYMKKAIENDDFEMAVERIHDRYKLNVHTSLCDFYQFMSFVSFVKDIGQTNISESQDAIDLYKGEYLKGNDYFWAERNRVLVREKYIALILRMATYYKASGQFNKLIELLKASLKYEPLHDGINARLFEALLITGNKITAVKRYNSYKRKLINEFGIAPNEEIERIMKRV